MRRWLARRTWRRSGVAASAAVVLGGSLAVAGVFGDGNPLRVLDLASGGAWVVSATQGLVTLIDGPSEQVTVSVPVPGAGHDLAVEQSGEDAYLVDTDRGTVAYIDAATYEVATPVALGTPGGALDVLQNDPPPQSAEQDARHVVYVVDPTARTATRVDPATLAVQHEVALAAQPGPGQSAVDHAGNLWVVDGEAGTVTRLDAGRTDREGEPAKSVRRTPAATATARVLLVEGRPVLADPAAGTVATLGADGDARVRGCLDTRSTDTVQLLGSRTSPEVYAAVAGALLVASTERQQCTRTIAVGDPATAQFGPLAQSGRYVFVPDVATGTTTVVDTANGATTPLELTEPGHRVQLEAKDGLVFYNDLDGHEAGVLTLRGDRWVDGAVDKYDPETGTGTNVVTPPDASEEEEAPAQDEDGSTPQEQPEGTVTPPPGTGTPPGQGGPSTGGPVITGLGVAPNPVVLGELATFTATVTGASGADWEWTLTDPGGASVTTSTQAGSFTHTLPTTHVTGAYQLRLTVTAGGRSTTQTLPVSVVPPDTLTVDSLATDLSEYEPLTSATVTAAASGINAPGTVTEWTVVNSADGPLAFTVGGTPDVPQITITDVGSVGDLTVTFTATRGSLSDSATVTVPVKYVCHISLATAIDVTPGGANYLDISQFDCVGDQPLTISLPSWLSGPTGGSTTTSGPTRFTFTQVASPPTDGDNAGAITVTFMGAGPHTAYPVDVHGNIPPAIIPTAAMPDGYTTCVGNGTTTTFYASYADGERSTLAVDLTNNGVTRRMVYDPDVPYFYLYVPSTDLAGGGWTVEATDEHGASSPVTNGVDSGGCW